MNSTVFRGFEGCRATFIDEYGVESSFKHFATNLLSVLDEFVVCIAIISGECGFILNFVFQAMDLFRSPETLEPHRCWRNDFDLISQRIFLVLLDSCCGVSMRE